MPRPPSISFQLPDTLTIREYDIKGLAVEFSLSGYAVSGVVHIGRLALLTETEADQLRAWAAGKLGCLPERITFG